METVVAALSSLCAGVAVYAGCVSVLDVVGKRPRRAQRRPIRMRESVVSWAELLGHWVPLIRLSNTAPVAAFAPRLQGALEAHGLALTQRGCVALFVLVFLATALICIVVSSSLLGIPVAATFVAAGTVAVVGRHERTLRDNAAEQMPEVLRSLSAALGAGKSMPQAIEYVGRNMGEPIGSEFLKASFEIKGGRSVEDAVGSLCERVEAPGIALVGTALQISQRTGSSLNDLFARTASMVGETVGLRRELQVKTSQVRLSAKIVAAMPALLACVLVLVSADYREGLSLPAGRACLCVAALLDVTALWIVQRVMSGSSV